MNKYLLTSGCSYTAGGGFNNPTIFELEFPTESIQSYAKYHDELSWMDEKFKNLIRPKLWPSILGKLSNYTDSFNVSAGGKGIYTSINTIYHFIFDWQLKGKDVTELEIIYQIPSYNRVEIYINDDNKHKSFDAIKNVESYLFENGKPIDNLIKKNNRIYFNIRPTGFCS